MNYQKYIKDAVRTEADYTTFEKKIQDDIVLASFVIALDDFAKAAAKLDALKKIMIYGKDLPLPKIDDFSRIGIRKNFGEH